MAYRRHRASFIGLLLGGDRHSPVYKMVTSVFLMLGALFFFIIWLGEKSAYDELKRTCISTADASIISVKTSSSSEMMTSAYVEFQTGGKKYTMNTPYTFDKKEVGGKVPVHYCPADPQKAYCYNEPEKPDEKNLGYAAVAAAAALVIFTFGAIEHKNGVESGGIIGDSLKAKNNFSSDEPFQMDDYDLARARMALSNPDYMHTESEKEFNRQYPGRSR